MRLRNSRLRDAITLAIATGAFALGGAAMAQEAATAQPAPAAQSTAAKPATTLDKVEVTGTRIRQSDLETAQPVLIISREDIDKSGFQSVADILQNISATGAPPISRASPLSAGEAAGGTFISLRNLGAQRTLVLLNGRRLGITTSGLSDVSTIPAAAVERIEVLKDGASSIYGSDAIAGVINIITRTNFEGASASVYLGQYDESDGDITKGDFVMGFTGEKGSATFAAEWGEEDEVKASARRYSAFPRSYLHPDDNWTPTGEFGGFSSVPANAFPNVIYPAATSSNPTRATRVVLRPGGDSRNAADWINQNTNTGSCTTTGCTPGSTLHKSNTNRQTDLHTPLDRKSLYVDGTYDITDSIRFRTNLLYSDRSSARTVAGYPLAGSASVPLSATSYFNPTGVNQTSWWRRTWEVPRVSGSDLTTYRFSGAFEGSFTMGERFFDWDVSYLRNTNKLVQSTFGNINLTNLRAAIGPSFRDAVTGQVRCGTVAVPIAGCTPFNPFVGVGVAAPGGLEGNQALRDYLFQEEHATGETNTTVFAANLSGTVFELPAGDLGFAFGYENRKEDGAFVPDALAVTGNSTNLSAGPTRGQYKVDELYLELEVPILADMAWAKELSLNVASRYSDYDTFGETTNNKIGLKWKPMDSLLLRATAADGFRAPTISDLYGGGSQTFSFFTDPCDTSFGSSATNSTTRANCAADIANANAFRQLGQGLVPVGAPNAQTPVAFTQGSNPTLIPEQSKSQTIGAVWSPTFAEGLNFALDWWKIRIVDTIVADTPNQILTDCYVQGIESRCSPSLFTRDPLLGYVNFMSFGSRNAGFRKVEGFDFDVSYRWSTDNWGDFNIVSNSTYTAHDYNVNTNDPRVPLSAVGFTSTFRIRSNLNVGWNLGDFSANWTTRYYSGMKEGCTYALALTPPTAAALEPNLECEEIVYAPTGLINADGSHASAISRRHVVGATVFNDLQMRWEAPWDATVAFGANNVLDKEGPVMYTQPSANVSYYGGFDIGRFLYLKYTQRF